MNAQEIYDKVAVHLLTQNAKSKRPRAGHPDAPPVCAYRGAEGRCCAAGCLLTLEEAEKADHLDEGVWGAVIQVMDLSRFANHTTLIEELQGVHDENEVEQWGVELAKLAEKHNLSTAVLR